MRYINQPYNERARYYANRRAQRKLQRKLDRVRAEEQRAFHFDERDYGDARIYRPVQ